MRYFSILILITLCNTSYCQNCFDIEYDIRWKQSDYAGRSRFIFNDSFSYYYFKSEIDSLQFETVFSESVIHHSAFCDKKLNLEYVGVNYPAGNIYLIKQNIKKLNWQLYAETKVILGHICFKAVTKIYSRKITVWYTKDLGVGNGLPYYAGLPGTILKIDDKSRNQRFDAVKITKGNYQFFLPEARIMDKN